MDIPEIGNPDKDDQIKNSKFFQHLIFDIKHRCRLLNKHEFKSNIFVLKYREAEYMWKEGTVPLDIDSENIDLHFCLEWLDGAFSSLGMHDGYYCITVPIKVLISEDKNDFENWFESERHKRILALNQEIRMRLNEIDRLTGVR